MAVLQSKALLDAEAQSGCRTESQIVLCLDEQPHAASGRRHLVDGVERKEEALFYAHPA